MRIVVRVSRISLVVVLQVEVSFEWWFSELLVFMKSGWWESIELLANEGYDILEFFLII